MKAFSLVPRLLLLTALPLCSCKKDFLNKLPSTSVVVPSTLSDFQQLLDNTTVMSGTPVLGEVSADNFYLLTSFWQSIDARERAAYNWAPDLYQGQGKVDDWDVPYSQVFYANVVLEGLSKIPVTTENQQTWQNEEGSALFLRAYAFYNVAQLFAPPYDSTSASSALGIPLRLHSDISAPSIRAPLADTYRQILTDLQQARGLLTPVLPAPYLNRPSQPAAFALLARICLAMRSYPLAGRYADSALQLYDSLIDYNTIDPQSHFPFTKLNPEVLYQSNTVSYTQCMAALAYPGTIVDSSLYRSYQPGDLRLSLFYQLNASGLPNMKPGYAGVVWPFTGLATDECYLIRAEAAARTGNTGAAVSDLNILLRHRYTPATFTPLAGLSPTQTLDTLLVERRKELPFRGLRWSDLRRLNLENRNIVLTRILDGTPDQLPPNSNLYTLPIPPDVLLFNPTMKQNPR